MLWKQAGWLGLYEIVPGFVLGALAIGVVSRAGRRPSAAMLARHDRVEAEMKSLQA